MSENTNGVLTLPELKRERRRTEAEIARQIAAEEMSVAQLAVKHDCTSRNIEAIVRKEKERTTA